MSLKTEIKLEDPDSDHLSGYTVEYSCSECKETFSNNKELSDHLTGTHKNYVLLLKCANCSEIFDTSELLEKHINNETKEYCDTCNQMFCNVRDLNAHIDEEHFEYVSYQCEYCYGSFINQELLDEHMGVRKETCPYCMKLFCTSSDFAEHIATHETEEQVTSVLPDIEVKDSQLENNQLVKTVLSHPTIVKETFEIKSDLRKFPCQYCSQTFNEKSAMIEHRKEHIAYQCDFCFAMFKSMPALSSHMQTYHSEQVIYVCEVCNDQFANREDLTTHVKTHNASTLTQHVTLKNELGQNQVITKKPKSLLSPVNAIRVKGTNKVVPFNSKVQLVNPATNTLTILNSDKTLTTYKLAGGNNTQTGIIQPKQQSIIKNGTISSNSGVGMIKSQTGKLIEYKPAKIQIAPSPNKVQRHMVITNNKQGSINNSSINASFNSTTNSAQKLSSTSFNNARKQERVYLCSYCQKGFQSLSSLNTHIRIHTGEKPFKCTFCEKAFCQKGDLDKHTRKHTGEKPYSCDYCEKAFTRSETVKTHVLKMHNGGITMQCQYCDRIFNMQSALANHVDKKHKKRYVSIPHSELLMNSTDEAVASISTLYDDEQCSRGLLKPSSGTKRVLLATSTPTSKNMVFRNQRILLGQAGGQLKKLNTNQGEYAEYILPKQEFISIIEDGDSSSQIITFDDSQTELMETVDGNTTQLVDENGVCYEEAITVNNNGEYELIVIKSERQNNYEEEDVNIGIEVHDALEDSTNENFSQDIEMLDNSAEEIQNNDQGDNNQDEISQNEESQESQGDLESSQDSQGEQDSQTSQDEEIQIQNEMVEEKKVVIDDEKSNEHFQDESQVTDMEVDEEIQLNETNSKNQKSNEEEAEETQSDHDEESTENLQVKGEAKANEEENIDPLEKALQELSNQTC